MYIENQYPRLRAVFYKITWEISAKNGMWQGAVNTVHNKSIYGMGGWWPPACSRCAMPGNGLTGV